MVTEFTHGGMGHWIDPSWSYFAFQPVLHNWRNKGCGIYYPVWGDAYKRIINFVPKSIASKVSLKDVMKSKVI